MVKTPPRNPWNQKHLDYEIETAKLRAGIQPMLSAWNQKHLDYEIETSISRRGRCRFSRFLEIKSISITRLKLKHCKLYNFPYWLEIKSISITRLKQVAPNVRWVYLSTWNQKHLDYEIETAIPQNSRNSRFTLKSKASRLRDWN